MEIKCFSQQLYMVDRQTEAFSYSWMLNIPMGYYIAAIIAEITWNNDLSSYKYKSKSKYWFCIYIFYVLNLLYVYK